MNRYAVGAADGRILRTVSADESQPAPLPGFGEQVIEVAPDVALETHYLTGGAAQPFPAKPSRFHTWDWATLAWAAPALADDKARKLKELRAARDAAELGTFTSNGQVFDCDERARARIAESAARALRAKVDSQPFQRTWTLADGSHVSLGRGQLLNLADALEDHTDAVRARWRAVRAEVAAATTEAQVAAVVW